MLECKTRAQRCLWSRVTRPRLSGHNKRLHYVDALRGLAALTVLFHHTTTLFPRVYEELSITFAAGHRAAMFVSNRNYEAVLLFFVVSGFSIRLSTGREGLLTKSDVG